MKSNRKATVSFLSRFAAEEAARKATEQELNVVRRVPRPEFRLWYLLNVEARREHTVSGHLVAKRIPVFFPEVRGENRGSRQPMFPGYVFARIDYEIEWSKVRSRPGVLGVVKGAEGHAIVVPFDVIEGVRKEERVALGGKPVVAYSVGSSVRVAEGPFYGFVGKVHRLAEQDRIGVLLELLGRSTLIEMDEREVVAI